MITKVEQDYCVQRLPGGEKIQHRYEDLLIEGKFIKLPAHEATGALEILFLNGGADKHSIMVSQIFAKVATAGA